MTVKNEKEKMALVKATANLPTEVGATPASAGAQALIQSQFVMALKSPRNWEEVRQNLEKECSRPSFALEDENGNSSALYRRPVGNGRSVEGLGIRFVELALRCMGNTLSDSMVVQESDIDRVIHVFVLDIEKNVSWGKTITVKKTVERQSLKDDEVPLSDRINSVGKKVYTVMASESAFVTKEAAEISKVSRTLGLRLIPGDLQDRCEKIIKEIREKEAVEDPDAALRRVIDGMAKQNVSVKMLEKFLDHPIAEMTPAEIVNLQSIYGSLRDGETTWREILAAAEELRKPKMAERRDDEEEKPKKGVAAIKEEIKKKKKKPEPEPEPEEEDDEDDDENEDEDDSKDDESDETEKESSEEGDESETESDEEESEEVCGSCGATDTPLKDVDGVMLCSDCQPKPKKKEEKKSETLPWMRTKPKTDEEKKKPEKKKSPPAAMSLEDQVQEMAKEKKDHRQKPKNAEIRGIDFPEFCDRESDDDAWDDELYERAVAAIKRMPGAADDAAGQLNSTAIAHVGIALEEMNAETLEALTEVLELLGKKKR
jgi:hypothetical protein